MKESFLIYKSFYEPIKSLSIENKGLLFDAIFKYQLENIEPEPNSAIYMPFLFFKNQFRLDHEKYLKVVERNKNNGSNGGRPKNPSEPKKPSGLNGNPKNPSEPKKPDNDNDNEKGNVNVNTEFQTIKNLLTDEIWKEQFCMKTKLNTETFDKHMNEFLNTIELTGAYKEKNILDIKSHFLNIVRKRQTEPDKSIYLNQKEKENLNLACADEYAWIDTERKRFCKVTTDDKGKYVVDYIENQRVKKYLN